jgi:hypothetical protein
MISSLSTYETLAPHETDHPTHRYSVLTRHQHSQHTWSYQLRDHGSPLITQFTRTIRSYQQCMEPTCDWSLPT